MHFSELKQKEVINVLDGRRMGSPIDLVFSAQDGTLQALTVPGEFRLSGLFKGGGEGVTVPWCKIVKIGDDVILVELDASFFRACALEQGR